MVNAKTTARMVEIAKHAVLEMRNREFDGMPDLTTLEEWGFAPVAMARRQMLDVESIASTLGEFQAAWETVNAWMEGIAEGLEAQRIAKNLATNYHGV